MVPDTLTYCPDMWLWWWHHQPDTLSALLALCAGNSPVTGEFPSQGPVTRSFHAFFDLRLNKRLSKQPRRRWFETPSRSLWRHSNGRINGSLSDKNENVLRYHANAIYWLRHLVVFVATEATDSSGLRWPVNANTICGGPHKLSGICYCIRQKRGLLNAWIGELTHIIL